MSEKRKSIAIYFYGHGSIKVELESLIGLSYKHQRFDIKLVRNIEEANFMIVGGSLTHKSAAALKECHGKFKGKVLSAGLGTHVSSQGYLVTQEGETTNIAVEGHFPGLFHPWSFFKFLDENGSL